MKRPLVMAAVATLLAAPGRAPADDVGDTPASAELRGTGSVVRVIEARGDQDVFQFTALPYVTNTVAVSTGTIWDCEVDLLTPSGAAIVTYTNTAADAPAVVRVVATAAAVRAYVVVRGLADYTTGTYQFAAGAAFPDVDADGLPDGWELDRFGTTTNAPGDDPDGDGLANRSEYLSGSDPLSAASGLRITAVSASSTADALVSWPAVPQGLYRLDRLSSLSGVWTPVGEAVLAVSNSVAWPAGPATNTSFFRVRLLY